MGAEAKAFLAARYLKASAESSREAFEGAFFAVVDRSKFRPDIAEIRDVLGLNDDPVERGAKVALENLLDAIKEHGVDMKPIMGEVIRERDNDGRILALPERAPSMPAPEWPKRVVSALIDFGYGDLRTAYGLLAEHPAVDPEGGKLLLRAKQVEDRWLASYRRAVRAA